MPLVHLNTAITKFIKFCKNKICDILFGKIIKDKWFFGTSLVVILLIFLLAAMITNPKVFRPAGQQAVNESAAVPASQYNVVLKNLSYESYYFKNGKLYQNVPIEVVNNISIAASSNTITVGNTLNLSIVYEGIMNFNLYYTTPFIKNTIDIEYFGYRENGSNSMLVYNNRPNATKFFIENTTPVVFQPANTTQNSAAGVLLHIVPTVYAANKTWIFCGGFFETYSNNTSWVGLFDNITYKMTQVQNHTVINKISGKCVTVRVYG